MKTTKYSSGAIKIIQIITEIFALQINFLFAAIPIEIIPVNQFSICVTCCNSASATQKEILFNELIVLAPTTPAKATFPDEETYTEINLAPTVPAEATFPDETTFPEINLATTTPPEASFDNDPESESACIPECLAPTTPAETDFND